jgi:asparagine synthase (glutamine-hydrolysing)
MLGARRAAAQYTPDFPQWLAPEFVKRFDLHERWRRVNGPEESPHPVRPRAYASFTSTLWQSLFESLDPAYTGVPLQFRHPYVDIRLLRFMLCVPALPWCRVKHLSRMAAKGRLPEVVRTRPKTWLNGHPDCEVVRREGVPPLADPDLLGPFADVRRWSEARPETVASIQLDLRLVALSYWLRDSTSVNDPEKERRDEGRTAAAIAR